MFITWRKPTMICEPVQYVIEKSLYIIFAYAAKRKIYSHRVAVYISTYMYTHTPSKSAFKSRGTEKKKKNQSVSDAYVYLYGYEVGAKHRKSTYVYAPAQKFFNCARIALSMQSGTRAREAEHSYLTRRLSNGIIRHDATRNFFFYVVVSFCFGFFFSLLTLYLH